MTSNNKRKKDYFWLAPIVGLPLMAISPSVIKKLSIYLKPAVDYPPITLAGYNITGTEIAIVLILLSLIFLPFYHRIVFNGVRSRFPNDKVECTITPGLLVMLFVEYCIGSFIGNNLLPAIVYFNYLPNQQMGFKVICIHTVMLAIVIIGILLLQYATIILTNKRIITFTFFGLIKVRDLQLKNIKTICHSEYGYDVIFNDGEIFKFLNFVPGAKKMYKRLIKLLEQDGRVK